MRKCMVAAILVLFLAGLTLCGTGCNNGKVDWKQVSQTAIKYALTQLVIPAYDQYAGDEDAVIARVMAELQKSALIDKYAKYVDVEAILHDIYQIIDAKWHEVLRDNGYDTDAATDETPLWYASASDFPECFE